jgi:hypothetical protein
MVSETSWQAAWMRSKTQPLLFVTDVLGAKPEPWQAEALEAVGRHDRVSIRSGHGVGKTTFESWLILWFLLTRKDCKIPVAANSQDQLRDTIWPEISKWHRQLPDALETIEVQTERSTRRLCRVFTPSICSEPMTMWPISARVNKPDNDDPFILDRAGEPIDWQAPLDRLADEPENKD